MTTAIWILVAVLTGVVGFYIASTVIKKNAKSAANMMITEAERAVAEAKREGEVIKEKKLLEAREESMKVLAEAEREAEQIMANLAQGGMTEENLLQSLFTIE